MIKIRIFFLTLLAALSISALADDAKHFYIGAGGGYAKAGDACGNTTSCDDTGSGVIGFVGYQPRKNIGVEVGVAYAEEYGATGSASGVTASIFDANILTFYITAVPRIVVNDKLSLFAKLGGHRWDYESDVIGSVGFTVVGFTLEDDGVDFLAGGGVEYKVTDDVSVRVEGTHFAGDVIDINYFGVSISAMSRVNR